MNSWILVILIVNISMIACGNIPSRMEPALLVVSFDGFRPEYLNRNVTKNLNQFRRDGVSANVTFNVFPTKTFVNHFSIATGLYPESHGVLANELYDTKLGHLSYSYDLFHYNRNIEPIWAINEKAGHHSGCMMWPGSNYEYNGIKCTFAENFNLNKTFKERIDTIMDWFTHKTTPANLVMFYIEEPDMHAHAYGVHSNEITKIIAQMDDLSKYIQDKLIENRLNNWVNVIHLSDHGMSDVSPPNFIDLNHFIDKNSTKMYGSSPIIQIVPNNLSQEDAIFKNLTMATKLNGHFKVYNQQNIPLKWHANNSQRLGPIFALADIGYGFQDLIESAKYYEQQYHVAFTNESKYGVHGYDNSESTMHPIFMAKGPIFAKGKTIDHINMIDLCNLFCFILKIQCSKNNGSNNHQNWNELFHNDNINSNAHKNGISLWVIALICMIILIGMISLLRLRRRLQNRGNLIYLERSRFIAEEFDKPLLS